MGCLVLPFPMTTFLPLLMPPAAAALSPTLCAVGAVHACGLGLAVLTRLVDGTRHAGVAQSAFLLLLGVVGLVCGVSFQLGPGASVFSAVSLAAMTLVAVADFRKPGERRD